jgi:large conductance mechanosensitive channel
MLKDFKAFVLRGNVVDLAIAVVIGAAFGAVVSALVKDFVTPLIAIPGKAPDFSAYTFTVRHSVFRYGDFMNVLLSFLILAAVIFFLVLKPINALMSRHKTEPEVESTTRDCPECLSSIPKAASRCAFCSAKSAPAV